MKKERQKKKDKSKFEKRKTKVSDNSGSIMNIREFNHIQRLHPHGAFDAVEYALNAISSLSNVYEIILYGSGAHQYEFLINDFDENHSALRLRVLTVTSIY